MSLSTRHLSAVRLLVVARIDAGGEQDPQRPKWQGLLTAVDADLASAPAANDTAAPSVSAAPVGALAAPALGALVFAIDLPLQVELPPAPPKPPKVLKRPLTEKQLAKLLLRQKKRAAKGPPKPVTLNLAATLNVYNGLKPWQKIKVREHLDKLIAAELSKWPSAHWGGTFVIGHGKEQRRTPSGGKRRLVRLTRFSARRPDEVTIDAAGGKFALDRMVQAQILGGDSDVWCARAARWEAAKPGEGRLRVEVYELLGEDAVPRTPAQRKKAARVAAMGRQSPA